MDQDPSMDQFWSFWIWRPRYSGVLTQFGCLWYFHTNEKLCVQEVGDPQDSRHLVASWQFFIAQLDYWKARQRVPLFRMFQKGITHRTPKEVPTCSNLFLSQICGLKESKSKPVEISFPKHGGTPKFHSCLAPLAVQQRQFCVSLACTSCARRTSAEGSVRRAWVSGCWQNSLLQWSLTFCCSPNVSPRKAGIAWMVVGLEGFQVSNFQRDQSNSACL